MIKDEFMPFPTHWTQVFVSWKRMMEQQPNYKRDAEVFILKWM